MDCCPALACGTQPGQQKLSAGKHLRASRFGCLYGTRYSWWIRQAATPMSRGNKRKVYCHPSQQTAGQARTLALKDRMVFTNCTRQSGPSDHRLLLASNRSCLLLLGYNVIKAHVELPLDLHSTQLCALISDCEAAAQPDVCLECQYRRALITLPLELKLVDQNDSSWPPCAVTKCTR